jgi:hypothetical protein
MQNPDRYLPSSPSESIAHSLLRRAMPAMAEALPGGCLLFELFPSERALRGVRDSGITGTAVR